MRVSAPLDSSSRSIAADWVELQALLDNSGVSELQLLRSRSVQSESDHGEFLTDLDFEPADEEILEPESDSFSERVYEELSYRENALGELYPFELDSKYGRWILKRRNLGSVVAQAAHSCYICCLLIASIHSELLPVEQTKRLFIRSAKIMQIESYLAAAEILGGKAFWFGSPRPDESGMLQAIQNLVKEMRIGAAPDSRPLGLSAYAADGTVDIVAWRPFRDGQPASVVAYGQVASGRNWKSKPIKAFIDGNFFPWFIKKPSHQHVEMLFVPILQHHELGESKSEDFRTVAGEEARLREMNFGVVIDRLRLTELMASSKVSGRYDEAEYKFYEATAAEWTGEAVAYAGGEDLPDS